MGRGVETRTHTVAQRARLARPAEGENPQTRRRNAQPPPLASVYGGRSRTDPDLRLHNPVYHAPGDARTTLLRTGPQGTNSRISLPDGTQVWLNAGSTLSYKSDFNRSSRDIDLSGEAYFEVARNADLPFRVEARGCRFTVLGTKFNISAYDSEPEVLAALMEGSLRFESARDREKMMPGDLVTYDCATKQARREQVDADQYRSWIDGVIRYDAITLPALLRRLAREYDVEIDLRTAAFDNKTFRISLTEAQDIHSIMVALGDILPITVNHCGRRYCVGSKTE